MTWSSLSRSRHCANHFGTHPCLRNQHPRLWWEGVLRETTNSVLRRPTPAGPLEYRTAAPRPREVMFETFPFQRPLPLSLTPVRCRVDRLSVEPIAADPVPLHSPPTSVSFGRESRPPRCSVLAHRAEFVGNFRPGATARINAHCTRSPHPLLGCAPLAPCTRRAGCTTRAPCCATSRRRCAREGARPAPAEGLNFYNAGISKPCLKALRANWLRVPKSDGCLNGWRRMSGHRASAPRVDQSPWPPKHRSGRVDDDDRRRPVLLHARRPHDHLGHCW